MKPAPFAYFRPDSVSEAVALLAEYGGEAKLLAGGQSLVPLMNFRLLRPGALIDINRLAGVAGIEPQGEGLRIGALTRHAALEFSPRVRKRFPVLAEAMTHVAHLAVRNRGTIGGSLSHADPAAELPMIAVLLDAEIRAQTPAGPRRHRAADFFLGPLSTALGDDEMVTDIHLPALPPGTGSAFAEVAMRGGDFAIAAVGATVTLAEGRVAEARLAVTGMGEVPQRLAAAEGALLGRELDAAVIFEAARLARGAVTPADDLRASADYRRHLVGVLTERALGEAGRRAA